MGRKDPILNDLISLLSNKPKPEWLGCDTNPLFSSLMTIYIPKKKKLLEEFVNSNDCLVSIYEVSKKDNSMRLEESNLKAILQSCLHIGEWEIKIIIRTRRMIEKSITRITGTDFDDDDIDFSLLGKNDIQCYNIIKKEMEIRFLNMINLSYSDISEPQHVTTNMIKPTDGALKSVLSLLNDKTIYIENMNYALTQYEFNCNITIKRKSDFSKYINFKVMLQIGNYTRDVVELVPWVYWSCYSCEILLFQRSSLHSALLLLFNIENIDTFYSSVCCILRESSYDNIKIDKINQISNISKEIIKIFNKYNEYIKFKQFMEREIRDQLGRIAFYLRSYELLEMDYKITKFNLISLQYVNNPFPFKSSNCDFILNVVDEIFNNQFTFIYDLYESILFIILGNDNNLSKFKNNFAQVKKSNLTLIDIEYNTYLSANDNDDTNLSDEDSINIPLLSASNCELQHFSQLHEKELSNDPISLIDDHEYSNNHELDKLIFQAITLMTDSCFDFNLYNERLNKIFDDPLKRGDKSMSKLDHKTSIYLFKGLDHFWKFKTDLFGNFEFSSCKLEDFKKYCKTQNVNYRIHLHYSFLFLFLKVVINCCDRYEHTKFNILRKFGMAENIIRVLNSIIPENDKYTNNDNEISKIIYGEFSKDEIDNLFEKISLMASFFKDRQLFTNFTFNSSMLEHLLTSNRLQ